MLSYKAPVEETLFLLRDVFPIERYNNLPGFADAVPDVVEAIVLEAARLCEETLQPLNQTGDREGCVRNPDGSVSTPRGFKDAYRAFAAGGWVGLAADPAYYPVTTSADLSAALAVIGGQIVSCTLPIMDPPDPTNSAGPRPSQRWNSA